MIVAPKNVAGLIMVEAALAIVVLTVGVLGAFVLFSTGLGTKTKAAGDTQAAIFADGAFNALRAESVSASYFNEWESFWDAFALGQTNVFVPAGGPEGVWADSNLAIRAGGVFTNIYTNFSLRFELPTNIVDHSLRYSLDLVAWPPTGRTNHVEATLKVWEGVFGPTNDDAASIFYTEFDNPGDL